ncbi:MAG: SH3 domain-containing protein [Clostridia bacterium]|nr:SH3 domain-containing protein [Clostridia bacterium]
MKTNKSKFLIIVLCITIVILAIMITKSFAMQSYYKVDFQTGLVTATNLYVRSGPGTQFKIVTSVPKNQYIRVFAGVGDWYVVQVEGDYIGAVSKKYVKPIYPGASNQGASNSGGSNMGTSANTNNNTGTISTTMNSDEKEVFDLINKQRTANGLSPLKENSELQRVARIKAQDMVNNNYFSHTSPTYGSPFDMMKSFKISYNTAGENIAGNSSNSSAVTAWMNSPGHRANILNSSFNQTGIGVVTGSKYGKIYVQMFIGK